MAEEFVWPAAHQLMTYANPDFGTPIPAQMAARPDRKQKKACLNNCACGDQKMVALR